MLLSINPKHPEPRKIGRATSVIRDGGLIAYPTDTVYGLGCDLHNKGAIERLYQAKGLDRKKPLALICADLSNIAKYAVVDNDVYRILKHHLPGAYTFVLPATRDVPKYLLTKQKTVGIRVPKHPVTHALVEELGHPLLNSTATDPDDDSPIGDPWTLDATYPQLDLVLEADSGGLIPTTVVDLTDGVEILRAGAGPIDQLV
ncbi:MAG: L-threonylcarbamoyladenylate synthase [Myxococcota bacterium]